MTASWVEGLSGPGWTTAEQVVILVAHARLTGIVFDGYLGPPYFLGVLNCAMAHFSVALLTFLLSVFVCIYVCICVQA